MAASSADPCFLLLVHEHPSSWAALVRRLLAEGGRVVIHLDAGAPDAYRDELMARIEDLDEVRSNLLWANRVAVRWGEWSMVEATLSGLECIEQAGFDPSHVCLLSGSDYPLRPLDQLRDYLGRHPGNEYIECVDPESVRWVKDGLQVERYRYRFFVNWREHPRLFSWLLNWQRRLGLGRELPDGLKAYMGSQWWVLTWKTCKAVLERSRTPRIARFFRRTWVPDELFFQTLVMDSLGPGHQVVPWQLTHHQFTEYGIPVVFCDGHHRYLSEQPFFFARKLSPDALDLRAKLDALARDGVAPPPDEEVGRSSGEYRRFMVRHRNGPEGRWSWGRRLDADLGELCWNRQPYLVVSSDSRAVLEEAMAQLRDSDRFQCHGRLFRPERIEFGSAVSSGVAGYADADVAIRDQDPAAFLTDLIGAANGRPLCFAWLEGVDGQRGVHEDRTVDAIIALDRRATWVRLVPPRAPGAAAGPGFPRWGATASARLRRFGWSDGNAAERLDRVARSVVPGPKPEAFLDPTREAGVQANPPRQRLVLHIGVHRTGTTSIQDWLHGNRGTLAAQGVHYAFDGPNHNDLVRDLEISDSNGSRIVNRIIAEAATTDAGTVVLSAEDLSWAMHVYRLAPLKSVFDVQVVCYLRRQDAWLESWYNQNVKWPWNARASHLSPGEFLQRRGEHHWIDYEATLRRWCDTFGPDAIVARSYEEIRAGGSLIEDFATFCGIDPASLSPPEKEANASVSSTALMMLRLMKLIEKPPPQRVMLISAVREVMDVPGAEVEPHVFSPRQRREVMEAYAASNARVARDYLGREGGNLFTTPMPPDDPTLPAIGLPPVKALRESVTRPLVRHYLRELLQQGEGTDTTEDRTLLVLALRSLDLRALRNRLVALLSSPWELRDLLAQQLTARAGRGAFAPLLRTAAPKRRPDLAAFVEALGLDGLASDEYQALTATVADWQGPARPYLPTLSTGPGSDPAAERLVRRWLEPLVRELGLRVQARREIQRTDAIQIDIRIADAKAELAGLEEELGRLRAKISNPLRTVLHLRAVARL